MRKCSIEGCEKKHVARSWCKKHYKRWYKWGDPLIVKRKPTTISTKKIVVKERKIRICQEENCNTDISDRYYNVHYCKDCAYFRAEYSRSISQKSEKNKAAKLIRNQKYRNTQRAKDLKRIYNKKYKHSLKQKRFPNSSREDFITRKREKKRAAMYFVSFRDDKYVMYHAQDWIKYETMFNRKL